MTAYQVWIHKREGWEFIVRLEDGRVTGVCDPAHALEAGEVQRFPYLEYATDDTSLYRFVEHRISGESRRRACVHSHSRRLRSAGNL